MKTEMRGSALLGGIMLIAVTAAAQNYPDPRPRSGETVVGTSGHMTIVPNPISSYALVTEEKLRHPDPNDWIMMRGNYEGYG